MKVKNPLVPVFTTTAQLSTQNYLNSELLYIYIYIYILQIRAIFVILSNKLYF